MSLVEPRYSTESFGLQEAPQSQANQESWSQLYNNMAIIGLNSRILISSKDVLNTEFVFKTITPTYQPK